MSEVSIVCKKWEFNHEGKTWELPRPVISVERDYATYLEKKSADFINRNREFLGTGFPEAMKVHIQNGVNNHYGWMHQGWFDSLADPINLVHLFWCWFRKTYPMGNELYVSEDKMYEMYRSKKSEMDTIITEIISDPNLLAP